MGTATLGEGGRSVNEITWNRVVLVDDHPMWIEVLDEDLTEEGFEIVAVAKDGTECLQRARVTHPDAVTTDLQIPALDGATCTELLVQESPDVQVLAISASGEREDVLRVMKSGAREYLVKSAFKAELTEGVWCTATGDAVFTPGLAGLVLGELRRMVNVAHSHDDDGSVLTTREVEALRQVAKGLTYREITKELFVSHRTAQNHVQNVLRKPQFHNHVKLTLYVIDQGLHDPNE